MEQSLRRIPFFADLPAETLRAIHDQLTLCRYQKGDIVFYEGDVGQSLYLIESGKVEVIARRDTDGLPDLVASLGPGSFFGEMALLLGGRRTATIRVTIDAELWRLRKRDLDRLLLEHASLSITLSRELGRRLSRTNVQPTQQETYSLITVIGSQTWLFAERLRSATNESLLLIDLGGLSTNPPIALDGITVRRLHTHIRLQDLADYLSKRADTYDRIVVAISPAETQLNYKAAEFADVLIEIGATPVPWVRRFEHVSHWIAEPTWPAVDRLARRVAGKLVGLALSSGNGRGIAHIGVLEALEEADIPIDVIVGTSAGALFGGLYATGLPLSDIKQFAGTLRDVTGLRGGLWDFQLPPRNGLIHGERTCRYLAEWFQEKHFDELDIPLHVVATDIITGEEVVLSDGSVATAVRASMGIPGIFVPYTIDGRHLADGALVNPLPISVLKGTVDIVLACSVLPSAADRARQNELRRGSFPSLFAILMSTFDLMAAGIVESTVGHVDVLIQPEVTHLGSLEYERWQEFVARGRSAAEHSVPVIQERLVRTPAASRHERVRRQMQLPP